MMYSKRFEQLRFEVLVAESGESCVQEARRKRPDAIVMELTLPEVDGFRVLERLRGYGETAGIPVVMLTTLAERDDIERCRKLGCCSYFIKPYARPDRVVSAIRELVADV